MAQGKKIGEFSLKSAPPTFTPGPGNTIAVQVNFEGSVTGEMAGLHRGTLSVVIVPGAKSRTYTYCGVTYPINGDPVTLNSQGTTEDLSNHKRRLRGVNHFSDGRIAAVEAEIDIPAGTMIGALYEWA
jgi:hypothetical protein